MRAALELERLQRWMQSVIVHPGTVEEALAGPAAAELPPERVGEVVLPSRSLKPVDRVGIYQRMYLLRMEEALASDYPGLKHFLGDEGFFDLVRGYVQAHPSRHYSLARLGDHLPAYVATVAGLKRPAFCAELARLELAMAEVFDAPETPVLEEADVASVPEADWEGARLQTIAAFRLLALGYPVSAYLDSLHDAHHQHPSTRRRATWVAIYRRQYSVYRHPLTRAGHDLLADLAGGKTLGAAVAASLKRAGRHPGEEELFRWFRQWVAGGVFASVRLS